MMNDCQRVEMREALPELVHGTLPVPERARLQEHVAECDDCAAELAIIRAVLASAALPSARAGIAPASVARITAAIPPYRRRSSSLKRVYLELAAACLIGAIGISAFEAHSGWLGIGGSDSSAVTALHASRASASASSSAGLTLVNTGDLSDAGLGQLTRDLDNLQAMPPVDPESVTPAALVDLGDQDAPGGSS
jgi:anti-sigma factor RsiW